MAINFQSAVLKIAQGSVPSRAAKIAALCAIGALMLGAQTAKAPEPQKTPAESNATAPAKALPPVQIDGQATLHHLNQAINWYRHCTTGLQPVGMPSDTIYQDNTVSLGQQAVRLAFQSARAEAGLLTAQQKANGANPAGETTQQQNLSQMEAKTSAQIEQLQSQIEA